MPISRETLLKLTEPWSDNCYFRVGVWDGDACLSKVALISLNPRNAITIDHCTPEEFCEAISSRSVFECLYKKVSRQSRARDNYDSLRDALECQNVVETNISAYPSNNINEGDLAAPQHIAGMKRASDFHSLLRPQFLLIAVELPWKKMIKSGFLDLGKKKEQFSASSSIPLGFKSSWREIEVYPSATFHDRQVTVMKIPQGSGRWLKGRFLEGYPEFFRYLGYFLRLQTQTPVRHR